MDAAQRGSLAAQARARAPMAKATVRGRASAPRRTAKRFAAAVIAAALLCGGVLAGVYALRDPVYTSTATLLFSNSDPSQALTGRASLPLAVDALEPVISDQVANVAAEQLNVTNRDIRDSVDVELGESGATLLLEGHGSTADDARALVQAVGDAYATTERTAAIQTLTQQAEALNPSIADIQVAIDQAPLIETQDEQLARTSQLQQLADLQSVQRRLSAAASQYPGQVQYFTQPELPSSPSSFTALAGMMQGIVLGLLGGALLAYALRERFIEQRPRRHASEQQQAGAAATVPRLAANVDASESPRSPLPHGQAPA